MPNNVGIYINKSSVDLVQLTTNFQGLKVINSIRVPIAASSGIPAKSNPVVEAIKEAVKKAKLKNVPVIAVLPATESIIRYFQIPILPIKERHKAIVFEAKKYIPFKLEEIIYDYSLAEVKKEPTAETMVLVFAAVKKDSLDQYLAYFNQAGLKVKVVEPSSLSLLRWYRFNSLITSNKSIALLELGGDNLSATLTVVKGDIPYFVREITLPTPLIADNKSEFNKEILERLLSEIHISLEYYKKWFQGEKADKIVLFSHTTTPASLVEVLTKEIDIPLESGALRKGLKTRGYLASELYLAAGAALRDKIKSKIKLNLYRAPKIGWFEGKKGTRKAIIIETVIAFLFLTVLYFIVSGPVKFNQTQLKNVISGRPQLEGNIDVNSFEALKEAKNSLIEKRNLLNSLIKNKFYWTPRLTNLVSLVPEGVWLTSLEFSKITSDDISSAQYSMLIKGKAFMVERNSGEGLAANFLENLKKDRYFSDIFKEINITSIKTQKIADSQVLAFEINSVSEEPKPTGRHR